jgi:hypothetical protein
MFLLLLMLLMFLVSVVVSIVSVVVAVAATSSYCIRNRRRFIILLMNVLDSLSRPGCPFAMSRKVQYKTIQGDAQISLQWFIMNDLRHVLLLPMPQVPC